MKDEKKVEFNHPAEFSKVRWGINSEVYDSLPPDVRQTLSDMSQENIALRERLKDKLTVRDEFAGMALQGLIITKMASGFPPAHHAMHAYKMADAMIAEGNKK